MCRVSFLWLFHFFFFCLLYDQLLHTTQDKARSGPGTEIKLRNGFYSVFFVPLFVSDTKPTFPFKLKFKKKRKLFCQKCNENLFWFCIILVGKEHFSHYLHWKYFFCFQIVCRTSSAEELLKTNVAPTPSMKNLILKNKKINVWVLYVTAKWTFSHHTPEEEIRGTGSLRVHLVSDDSIGYRGFVASYRSMSMLSNVKKIIKIIEFFCAFLLVWLYF